MNKTSQLKRILSTNSLDFFLEAHNALSAKIVEEAGFSGIWGSGLTLSATLGVRDCNEASWTQILEILEFMSDTTNIPILFDGDTGYGNFNNARRLAKKLEQRGIAGVCLEDKIFPKINSFIPSKNQILSSIDEFTGKIKAVKDVQKDPDFCLVARTEAFIVGLGLEEALKRCEAYSRAGADAILVHSKKETAEEILNFLSAWNDICPVVIVPTTYATTPTILFKEAGVRLVLWANHLLRGAIDKMQHVANCIKRDESVHAVEQEIASLSEIFRLQNMAELHQAEKKYLP